MDQTNDSKDRLRRISLDLRKIVKSLENATAKQRRIQAQADASEDRRQRKSG